MVMAMDLERQSDGRMHFILGRVERWVVAMGALVLTASLGVIFNMFADKLDENSKTLQTVVTQQAVANGQVATLNAQLADVPSLVRKVTEHEVRLDRVETDVKELRATKGLR